MATLNTVGNPNYGDDEEDSSASLAPVKNLTWSWRTWPKNLRQAIVVAFGVLVALIALLVLLQEQDKDLTQKLNANAGNKSQAQTKLRESGQERDTIVKHLPILKELTDRSIFGDEKRLEWVEQLRIIEKRWPSITIKYNISPQKLIPKEGTNGSMPPIPAAAKLPNGDPLKHFGVFSTDMKLSLTLMHEGDALAIFDDIKAASLGLFSVKKCTLKRPNNTQAKGAADGTGGPVFAECTLVWTSMNAYLP